MSGRLRLQVALARAGLASRRAAAETIEAGRVTVNGSVVREAGRRVTAEDEVRVDNELLTIEPLRYYALHKPRGVLSSASDDRGRPVVTGYLPTDAGRCVPVGRLDLDSEGLLLLSNDGPLIDGLLHPRSELPREYLVELRGRPSNASLDQLYAGVELDDGAVVSGKPKRLRRPASKPDLSWIGITVRQGRKREVRRMCEAIGHRVERLIRVRFGPIRLRELEQGTIRPLTEHEVRLLYHHAGLDLPAEGNDA